MQYYDRTIVLILTETESVTVIPFHHAHYKAP